MPGGIPRLSPHRWSVTSVYFSRHVGLGTAVIPHGRPINCTCSDDFKLYDDSDTTRSHLHLTCKLYLVLKLSAFVVRRIGSLNQPFHTWNERPRTCDEILIRRKDQEKTSVNAHLKHAAMGFLHSTYTTCLRNKGLHWQLRELNIKRACARKSHGVGCVRPHLINYHGRNWNSARVPSPAEGNAEAIVDHSASFYKGTGRDSEPWAPSECPGCFATPRKLGAADAPPPQPTDHRPTPFHRHVVVFLDAVVLSVSVDNHGSLKIRFPREDKLNFTGDQKADAHSGSNCGSYNQSGNPSGAVESASGDPKFDGRSFPVEKGDAGSPT
ncbi:hypothetical protein B0H19DRAFT_1059541 [Mycena capillaripes]|nr:hypothetical protein B0H19DRAFT_1059541 [Mycena capillaripes]